MAVHDRVAVREPREEPRLPPRPPTGVVDEPDPRVLDLDDDGLGQPPNERRLVVVAGDGLDRRV
jgi:hypothetical protein